LILPIFGYRFSLAHLGEKYFGIKRGFNSLPHKGFPFSFSQGLPFPPTKAGRGRGIITIPLRKGTHDLVNVARLAPSIEAGHAAWSLPAQEREIAQARSRK
jgi:hypothetical protein